MFDSHRLLGAWIALIDPIDLTTGARAMFERNYIFDSAEWQAELLEDVLFYVTNEQEIESPAEPEIRVTVEVTNEDTRN